MRGAAPIRATSAVTSRPNFPAAALSNRDAHRAALPTAGASPDGVIAMGPPRDEQPALAPLQPDPAGQLTTVSPVMSPTGAPPRSSLELARHVDDPATRGESYRFRESMKSKKGRKAE